MIAEISCSLSVRGMEKGTSPFFEEAWPSARIGIGFQFLRSPVIAIVDLSMCVLEFIVLPGPRPPDPCGHPHTRIAVLDGYFLRVSQWRHKAMLRRRPWQLSAAERTGACPRCASRLRL